jgi:AcrR family transcriptional regulator
MNAVHITVAAMAGKTKRPMGRLRERLHAATAEAMLASAERTIIRHGYERATMQEIAADAGCATGTFYLYFKNKKVLFEAIVDRHAKAMFAVGRAEMETSPDPLEKIRLGILGVLRYVREHRAFFRLFLRAMPMRFHAIEEEVGPTARLEHEDYSRLELDCLRRARRQGRVRSDVPLDMMMEFMDAVALSLVEQFVFTPHDLPVEEQVRILWGLITGGIGARSRHAK